VLQRLPGLPSNWRIQRDPVVPKVCVEGVDNTCWRVGALVALLEEVREPPQWCALSVGRGLQSVGCIKSVNLEDRTVELAVVVGHEVLVSQTQPEVGQLVRLSASYATLGDARMGILQPGENGVVLHVERQNGKETLILVKRHKAAFGFSADRTAGDRTAGEECSWWYPCEALALSRPFSFGDAADKQKLAEKGPVTTGCQPATAPATTFGGPATTFGASTKSPAWKDTGRKDASGFVIWEALSRPSVGSQVALTAYYKKVEDAELGPLKLGDVGILKGDDSSDTPFQVQAPDGTLWHYKAGAIEDVPGTNSNNPTGPVATFSFGEHTSSFATSLKSCTAKMESLRIIHTDDLESLPRAEVPPAWSMLSELQALPAPSQSDPNKQAVAAVFTANTLLKLKQRADAEEDLEEQTSAPIFRLEDSVSDNLLVDAAMAPATSVAKVQLEDSTIRRLNYYDVITKFDQFAAWGDRNGNLAAHHLAYAGLGRSLQLLCSLKKSLRWAENRVHTTPLMIADGVVALGCELPLEKRTLYRAIVKGDLLRMGNLGSSPSGARYSSKLISKCMRCPDDYETPEGALKEIAQCLSTPGTAGKTMALDLASKCADARASIYSAVAMLDLNMGPKQVFKCFEKYLQQIQDDALIELVDPMLYYARYFMWSKTGGNTKSERVSAACALTALRCFPNFAAEWVDDDDDIDRKVKAEGLMEEQEDSDADDDDELDEYSDSKDSPEIEWKLAKSDHNLTAEAMDSLMALTGLRGIKKKAMGVVKEVLLQKDRPASVKAETSMNFLFTGNPGCGKTTVAQLLARAMTQLGFRKNDVMIETSAQEILKSKDPGGDFADMMEQATGGCLFIDEAYRFTPSPPGQQPNSSNQVLDYLLEAVEKPEIRSTTTVILAGYRDEIETLLSYNVGFASRFNITFSFPDYNELQLRKIFVGMVKDKGFELERKKDCGVSISAVMANRIHRGAGKKGFGNAREVRNKLEEIISQQSDRLGALKLRKKPVSQKDYQMLLAVDSVGLRPDFSFSPTMKELDSMVGLEKVKAAFRSLMSLQQQNFDREMRGDKPELISLHRVFYGNPGTGKTTVAKLYGSLLKELGLLSNGDFICVSPADLTGDHEGGAATQTKAVLDKAKGKVLLIDEAYVLDPKRGHNIYGGNVLDTMVEKLDGEAGSDCAVILAGYRQEMYDMLENNPGLRRRFNIDQFGIEFEDMADDELRQVLITGVGKAGLFFEDLADLDAVVAYIGQQRRMPGFGNAGTVNSLLHSAKVAKSRRLDEAKKAHDKAVKQGTVPPPLPSPDALLKTDFLQNEVGLEQARDKFQDLYNVDHIQDVLDELEATILQAKEDGKEPADVLADSHMVFVGPPGTGKTTVANKFGKLLKDLKVLPSDNVTLVTGTSLQGQYVGETKEKVNKAMHQARGGILFIDEAYGMAGGKYSASYAKEAVDTLVGQITTKEFKGNLLVIMAGYETDMDTMFANSNPGLASRFNKKRVKFLPWGVEVAVTVVTREINEKQGKTITPDAIALLRGFIRQMHPLPSWGSARDVFETILPALYTARATRLRKAAKEKQMLEATGTEAGAKSGASKRKAAQGGSEPYTSEDVSGALEAVVASRMQAVGYENYQAPEPEEGFRSMGGDDSAPRQPPKVNVEHKVRIIDEISEDEDEDDADIFAALEQACVDLGYTEDDIADMLRPGGDYTEELLNKIVDITGCNDLQKIRAVLDKQKHALLARVEALIELRKKEQTEEEAKIQEKLKKIGRSFFVSLLPLVLNSRSALGDLTLW
jgi:SpoVK/Ycf46/Vps4 family AAA+-type ATPase